MTQPELFQSHKANQRVRLHAYLSARPNRWIPLPELVRELGIYRVPARKHELNKQNGTIENRTYYHPVTKEKHSEYRMVR